MPRMQFTLRRLFFVCFLIVGSSWILSDRFLTVNTLRSFSEAIEGKNTKVLWVKAEDFADTISPSGSHFLSVFGDTSQERTVWMDALSSRKLHLHGLSPETDGIFGRYSRVLKEVISVEIDEPTNAYVPVGSDLNRSIRFFTIANCSNATVSEWITFLGDSRVEWLQVYSDDIEHGWISKVVAFDRLRFLDLDLPHSDEPTETFFAAINGMKLLKCIHLSCSFEIEQIESIVNSNPQLARFWFRVDSLTKDDQQYLIEKYPTIDWSFHHLPDLRYGIQIPL